MRFSCEIKVVLVLCVSLSLFEYGLASEVKRVEAWDSHSPVEYRQPPYEEIESLKENKSYQYDREGVSNNFIDRVMAHLLRWLQSFSFGLEQVGWIRYVFVGFVVLVFVLLILRMLNVPIFFFFSFARPESVSGLELSFPDSAKEQKELEKMLGLYRENGAYREAVRVLYLIYLRRLNHKGFIQLRAYKTNREYESEITDRASSVLFRKLARIYEYVWFGQIDPDSEQYEHIEYEFNKAYVSSANQGMIND